MAQFEGESKVGLVTSGSSAGQLMKWEWPLKPARALYEESCTTPPVSY